MKISFSLRAFVGYFIILAGLSWFIIDNAIERINLGLRQSAESVLVDTANIIASMVESSIVFESDEPIRSEQLADIINRSYQRTINANIYEVQKNQVDLEIYVTDKEGIVIYDSTNKNIGEDFSEWRDVRLTLEGGYGARTSYKDPLRQGADDPKVMVIAAPIQYQENIIGVVSVAKPIRGLEVFLLSESDQLKRYAIIMLVIALILGYLVSHWFTLSLIKLSNYAKEMGQGTKVSMPRFLDKRFDKLAKSITDLRSQIDGKDYVEKYIHGLTHELKTPITAIRGATELLQEDLPPDQKQRFLNNVESANNRMARLVERMLSLAQLEGKAELSSTTKFDVIADIHRLIQERDAAISMSSLQVDVFPAETLYVNGDALLIQQALANLMDNAIDFCTPAGVIDIKCIDDGKYFTVHVCNQGEPVPEYAFDRLYERFFSLPRPVSGQKSTGLGLSFVFEIMKLHNGKISLTNEGEGVCATLKWPHL